MIVSNCCGAEFHDLETKICMCCNEHADEIEQDKPSINVVEIEEYNHTVYRRNVVAVMVEKYGSFANAIFEMEARIASLETDLTGMREVWMKKIGQKNVANFMTFSVNTCPKVNSWMSITSGVRSDLRRIQ